MFAALCSMWGFITFEEESDDLCMAASGILFPASHLQNVFG
jgi:hypothetical protein